MPKGPSVLHHIAERRAADLAGELGDRSLAAVTAEAPSGPTRREVAGRFARPGLHLIGEIKRYTDLKGVDEDKLSCMAQLNEYLMSDVGGSTSDLSF